jgi:branched-chain amino acid transport system permease protein
MEKFLQTLMDAIAVGSLYALIALGYTMVYGILKFINFAHSDVFTLGAWTAFVAAIAAGWTESGQAGPVAPWLWTVLGAVTAGAIVAMAVDMVRGRPVGRSPTSSTFGLVAGWGWACIGLLMAARFAKTSADWKLMSGFFVLLCSMATCGLVGFLIERFAYRPLRKAPRLNVLITAIGVSLLLQNVGQLSSMFNKQPQRMPELLPNIVLTEIGGGAGGQGVRVMLVDVVGAGTAFLLMILLDRLVFKSKLGRAMRAVSYNTTTAALMGIPVDRVISFTFVLGSVLAAAAGVLYGMKYPGLQQTAAEVWVLLGLKAFVAAVVGGIGNIRGAMLGGLMIGALELFGAAYFEPALRDVYVFGLLVLVLLFKPSGLLGKATVEKV